jgi:two-component system cell cycle sensor histidine kinase/response regulator CckA
MNKVLAWSCARQDYLIVEEVRILLVEDQDDDAELAFRELRRAGVKFRSEHVRDEITCREALDRFAPDIVLSDHALPTFTAFDVLRVVHERYPQLPVIVVSGRVGEESSIEYVKAGAVDYVVKDRLYRLPDAVNRALALRRAVEDRVRAETKLRRLEDDQRQMQKMEAIGRLASGVAHDFNNLLTVIRTVCEIVLQELPEDSTVRDDIVQIRKASESGSELTRQLLTFSRRQPLVPQRLDLNALVTRATGMLRHLLGKSVTTSFKGAEDLGAIYADPGQIEQVLMNLAVNARDAMAPGGGPLTIATANSTVDASEAAAHGVAPGPYVQLAVSDTGRGIDEVTRARLFEPFFTTKDAGRGTGLGLATVYGIVQQSGGFVDVDSVVGTGSTFRVYLPRVVDSGCT